MSDLVTTTSSLGRYRLTLAGRTALLALVVFCEKFALTFLVNYSTVLAAGRLGSVVRVAQHVGFRFAVSCAIALAVFGYATADRQAWSALNALAEGVAPRPRWLGVHVLLILLLTPLTFFIYGRDAVPAYFAVLVALWMVLASAAVAALFAALAPWSIWRRMGWLLGASWFFAVVAAVLAVSAMRWSQQLWAPTANITFDLVRHLLSPIIPSLQADPLSLILSSSRFSIRVSPLCSGLEGIGLMLAFCGGWLLCLRREFVFPRALLLLPVAVVVSFAANALRISALMLIGYAGYPTIAVYGFHSQAGWIAFNATAALIAFAAQRSRWLRRVPNGPGVPGTRVSEVQAQVQMRSHGLASASLRDTNPTAVYLLPFLFILAGGMLARAISSGFETLYILRVLGASAALVWAWPRLRGLDWHCSWRGLCAGVAVFSLWAIAAHRLTASEPMPATLAHMSVTGRTVWLTVRLIGAVITVPLAEELAFRGYLMRRVAAVDFESVRFRNTQIAALLLSSLLFGLEEGAFWLPGLIAAVVFAGLLIRTERMGEAVLAHATTNAMLALYVLLWHQWQLW